MAVAPYVSCNLVFIATQYSLLRDIHEKRPHVPSIFEPTEYFGQLKSILVVELPPRIVSSVVQPKTLVLAIISTRNTTTKTPLKIPYYTEPKSVTVSAVDVTTLMCLISRIKDRGW